MDGARRGAGIVGLLGLVLLGPTWSISAQEQVGPRPGERVRVQLACRAPAVGGASGCPRERETGVLVELEGDRLVLESEGSTVTYPLSSVTRLEASRGSTSRWKAGALIGFLAGAGVTFAILDSGDPASTNPCDPSSNQDAIGGPGTCLLIAGVVGGLPGGLLGLFVGSRLRTERWETVSLGRVGMTLLPLAPRPSLAVSVHHVP